LFSEPATLASLYVCGEYSLSGAHIPAGCEWLGADGIERVDVQLTLVSSVLVGLAGLLVWWRRLRHSRVATIATAVGVIGLIMNVIVVPQWHTVLPAIAITLIGGWLVALGIELLRAGHGGGRTRGGAADVIGAGRASGRTRGFGWLTVVFGALGLLHAIDKAIVMLPWIPLSPAWFRLLVGLVWVVWAVVLGVGRRSAESEPAATAVGAEPRPA
jgi:hypothetical protein